METNPSTIDHEPTGSGSGGRLRSGLAGVAIGIGAAVGALALVSSGAGADTVAPGDGGQASDATAAAQVLIAEPGDVEAIEDHIACIEEAFDGLEASQVDEAELTELTDAELAVLDAEVTEAFAECDELIGDELWIDVDELDGAVVIDGEHEGDVEILSWDEATELDESFFACVEELEADPAG